HALQAALRGGQWEKRFHLLREISAWLRPALRESGLELVGADESVSPAVVTIAAPKTLDSVVIGELAQEAGYLLSFNSTYLRQRNWVQICLMSDCSKEKLVALLNALKRICSRARTKEPAECAPRPE
ncbi:MAG TPA: hypothetical protein VHI52_17500, partial [Verrucomicrobiae bacterium]|nr:hypothetical protein [Verrucomicrobiae bacterium]